MAKTSLREVLEAIAFMARGIGNEKHAGASQGGELKARYTKRLTELTAQVKALGSPAGLLGDLRAGAGALKDGDLERVAGLLKQIEAGLSNTGKQAAPVVDDVDDLPAKPLPTPQAMADIVKPRLKLLAVESAYELAVGNLEVACRAMLRTAAFETDPMAEDNQVQAAIDAVGERVPAFASVSAVVQDTLARLARAAAADQAEAVAPALSALATYRRAIDGEPLLREMETSDAGNYPIHSALSAAVDELVDSLSN